MRRDLYGRLISVLLALVVIMGVVSVNALPVSAESSDVRTVYASNLYDDMTWGLSDDTVLVMDVDRRLSKITGEDCDLTIIGDKTLTVASDNKVAIDVRSLTVEANLIATSPTEYYFGSTISVTRDFSFLGESLWVGGANGIHSEAGDIEIYGRTTILCTQGAALHAESGSIIVNAPYIKCTVDENDIYSRSHCAVEASGSVKIASDEGIFVGVDAGIRAGAMVTLGGNISCEGNDYGIYSEYGSVCFDGEKLYAYGETGIYAGNDVTITATNGGVGGDINAIRTNEGNIELNGVNYIASADDTALLAELGNITLNGTNHITSYGRSAIFAREGAITMTGSVTARGGDGYCAVCAENNIYFVGTKLDVAGDSGIKSLSGNIIIDADSTTVVTTVGAPIITTYYVFGDYIEVEGGAIYIDSDYLYLQNKMEGEYYSLAQWDGIMAGTSVTVYSKDATIIGEYGVSANGDINLYGKFDIVGSLGAGVYCGEGTVTLDGDFDIISVNEEAIDALDLVMDGTFNVIGATTAIECNNLTYTGSSLQVSGVTGIHAVESVDLNGDDIRITPSGSRSSGIWCEGVTCLAGEITIRTNGWYGINGEGNVSLFGGCIDIAGPMGDAQAIKVGGELYMDESLSFIAPSGAHLRGTDICDATGFPAKEVLIGQLVDEVSVLVTSPVAGRCPDYHAENVYYLSDHYSAVSVEWYNGSTRQDADEPFEAGVKYTVKITFRGDGTYRFAENKTAKINGSAAVTALADENREMTVTYTFEPCSSTVDHLQMTVTAPKEGECISYSVSCGNSTYGLVGNSSNYTDYRQWYESDDGENWTEMSPGDTFHAGKYYRFYVDIQTATGYEFPLYDDGSSIQPDVTATVNGYTARVIKAYDQDPSRYITVVYDFGQCNDSVIEHIIVENVYTPVPGELPRYSWSIQGSGYQMDTAWNKYYDDWQNDQKLYYIKNGIGWYDVTAGDWICENETFLPGHEYEVTVFLKTEDGYHFTNLYEHDALPSATVNGMQATVNEAWSNAVEARVNYTFTCEPVDIVVVMLSNLEKPVNGKTPDFSITAAHSSYYMPDPNYGTNGIYWYDEEGNVLMPEDTFRAGERYKVEIKLIPVQVDGANMCAFASPLTAYINGHRVTERLDWDNVYVSKNAVYLYYTFVDAASEPETGPCFHIKQVQISEKESSCVTQGWDAYAVCTDCGQILSSDGITELEKIPLRPLGDHSYSASESIGPGAYKETCVCGVSRTAYTVGWSKYEGAWYYRNQDYSLATGWLKSGGYWYYLNSSGVMQTGWVSVNGKWYYLNQNGVMITGWVSWKNNWYYMDSAGIMQTGWVSVNGKWYYLDSAGIMQTGWLTWNGKKYYLQDSGVAATGLFQIDGKYYCFAAGGSMQTGWQTINGTKHLFGSDGKAVTGWYKTGGNWYYLKNTGAITTGWAQVNGKWYYLNQNGVMQTGWVSWKNNWYYMDSAGIMQTGWLKWNNKWYYLDAAGIMQTGWLEWNGKTYYLGTNGVMVTGTQVIDGKTYHFGSNGVWVP